MTLTLEQTNRRPSTKLESIPRLVPVERCCALNALRLLVGEKPQRHLGYVTDANVRADLFTNSYLYTGVVHSW